MLPVVESKSVQQNNIYAHTYQARTKEKHITNVNEQRKYV